MVGNGEDGFEKVREAWRALDLPGITEGLSWGTLALFVDKKMMVRLREPDVLVLMMDALEKEMRMQLEPSVYFQIDHYKSSPAVLVRISAIDIDELSDRLASAWRMQAKPRTRADYEKLKATADTSKN